VNAPSVGVIGAGTWGKNVIRGLADLGELAAVADLRADNLRAAQASYPQTPCTHNANDIFDSDVASIAITTPASTHVELALRALGRGKHVFVEKPLALTEEGAIAVARTAEKSHCKVFVGHLLLYHPAILAMKQAIAFGEIGEIVHVRSRRLSPGRIRVQENVWWSFAPHDVALALSLLGEPISYSACEHAQMQEGVADFVYADLQFQDDRTAHIEVTWLDPDKSSRIDVFGSRGVVSVETASAEPTCTVRSYSTERAVDGIMPLTFELPRVQTFSGANALLEELRAFLSWTRGGQTPPTDGAQGVRVVRTLASIARQSASNAANLRLAGRQRFILVDDARRETEVHGAP